MNQYAILTCRKNGIHLEIVPYTVENTNGNESIRIFNSFAEANKRAKQLEANQVVPIDYAKVINLKAVTL